MTNWVPGPTKPLTQGWKLLLVEMSQTESHVSCPKRMEEQKGTLRLQSGSGSKMQAQPMEDGHGALDRELKYKASYQDLL